MRRADAHPILTNLRSSGHRRKISGICSFWLEILRAIESMAKLQSSPALFVSDDEALPATVTGGE